MESTVMIRSSHPDVRRYRKQLDAFIAKAEKAGELGVCAVALAYCLSEVLEKYLDPEVIRHVGMDHIDPTHDLIRALTNTIGGDTSVQNQEKLIASFTDLMAVYKRTVRVSD